MIEVKNQRILRKVSTFTPSKVKLSQNKFDWSKINSIKKINDTATITETNSKKSNKYTNSKLFQTQNTKSNYNFSLFAMQRIKEEKNILSQQKHTSQFKRSSQKKLKLIGLPKVNTILNE